MPGPRLRWVVCMILSTSAVSAFKSMPLIVHGCHSLTHIRALYRPPDMHRVTLRAPEQARLGHGTFTHKRTPGVVLAETKSGVSGAAEKADSGRQSLSLGILVLRFWTWFLNVQRRFVWWIVGFLPLTSIIRAVLRWYAFSASRAELGAAIVLMRDAVLPVCTGALAVAELREEVLAACGDGSCPLAVKEALDQGIAVNES